MSEANSVKSSLFRETELPLEVVMLFVGGMALAITGILLFAVSCEVLPYYENGFVGLMLVLFALQTITMGKTPFGDMRRSKPLLAAGIFIAGVGIIASIIPVFRGIPRLLLLLCFGPGGLFLFLNMCLSRDKLRTWARLGGIFRHLIIACSAVYIFSMILAVLLWTHSILAGPAIASVVLVYGLAVFYLAGVLLKVYHDYPGSDKSAGSAGISADQAVLLLLGVFMLVLGLLLVPVSFRLAPFSPSAQIGLLMVIFAVQMLAAGSTPVGPFPRSWPVIAFGSIFAVLGIASSIVPGVFLFPLTILVGVLNILGGVVGMVRVLVPRLKDGPSPLPALRRLFIVQFVLNVLGIMFGTSMLMPGLVHLFIIGAILAVNGCVLLCLLYILVVLDRLQTVTAKAA